MKDTVCKKIGNVMECAHAEQHFQGCANDTAQFLEREALTDPILWAKFVNQFREQIDGTNNGWRGEYWGKMMRGAVTVYEYTQSETLYNVLTDTVRDLLTVIEPDGRISSFSRDTEFHAWDLWSRKYVMLGMEYYLEVCRDEALQGEIVAFLCRVADYILEHIGEGNGKIPITSATNFWLGLNSVSILEPIVRPYELTGEQRYFDFAAYIIGTGGTSFYNIFELAYENKLYPYQYGVAKAYEMISCFEGLLEFYNLTGIEKYRVSAVNFGKAILDSDVTVIGSCGCTHELFDHSKNRQTAYYEGIMQETCVTVTWMKYCSRLLRLTGERVFADCMEQSFYNAYLGAVNTEHCECACVREKFAAVQKNADLQHTYLPFDSYSPLTPDRRGRAVGGLQFLSDHSYYGCCACIGAAGVGVFLSHAVMKTEDGIAVNFYEKGVSMLRLEDTEVTLKMDATYPVGKSVTVTVCTAPGAAFALRLRLPAWSEHTAVTSAKPYTVVDGYAVFDGIWSGEETLALTFDMRIRLTRPIVWESDLLYNEFIMTQPKPPVEVHHDPADDRYISLARGPLVLAADARTGKDVKSAFAFVVENGEIFGRVCDEQEIVAGVPCMLNCAFTAPNGERFRLVDYASAGKDWETTIAAWLPTE
ncbi:MAG: glycoside hydrolase family 127 protein [Clostridia bacterium]|nr:glycoside hydrolase family 127 protein [Clostridia bacterium]